MTLRFLRARAGRGGRRDTSPTQQSVLTSRVVTTLLTALAAFVGLVYLLGAGVLWIRLAREGLPTEAVITSLPRELLLSVGLRSILLPAFVYSGLGVLVLILVERRTPIGVRSFRRGSGYPARSFL
jgi:hypothetical protein